MTDHLPEPAGPLAVIQQALWHAEVALGDEAVHQLAANVATQLASAGYFDAVEISDDEAAAQIEQLRKEVDAYHGFAERLAEAAQVAPDSPLVRNVEDLVDAVIIRILSDDDPATTGTDDD